MRRAKTNWFYGSEAAEGVRWILNPEMSYPMLNHGRLPTAALSATGLIPYKAALVFLQHLSCSELL